MVAKKSSKFSLVKIWLMVSSRAAQSELLTNSGGLLFIIGKVVRFLLFLLFINKVVSESKSLIGYNLPQVTTFFLVFYLVETITQFLFRGVYHFRFKVVSGEYDIQLLKPLPSFFLPIFGWTDILDLITFIPLIIYFIWYISSNNISNNLISVIFFILLFVNSLVLGFAFHLFTCAVCILTLQVDHMVMIYRDLSAMARFPTDIYQKGIQFILTFTIPVIILITVPTKALMGILSWPWVIVSFLICGLFLVGSLRFWRYSLKRYSSASS